MQFYKFLLFVFLIRTNSQKIYNYYELALQKWCSDTFMIHGLWPQINAESYPVYCESVEYSEPTGVLLDNMEIYWKGCDNSLWEHEWEKHGSCVKSQNNISESIFFNITLELFLQSKYLIREKCDEKSDNCIVGCFDLDYDLVDCV